MSATTHIGPVHFTGHAQEGLAIGFAIGDLEFLVVASKRSHLDRISDMIGQQLVSPNPVHRVVIVEQSRVNHASLDERIG